MSSIDENPDEVDLCMIPNGNAIIDGKVYEPQKRVLHFDEYDMYVLNRED